MRSHNTERDVFGLGQLHDLAPGDTMNQGNLAFQPGVLGTLEVTR